jgi:hypothetical protein
MLGLIGSKRRSLMTMSCRQDEQCAGSHRDPFSAVEVCIFGVGTVAAIYTIHFMFCSYFISLSRSGYGSMASSGMAWEDCVIDRSQVAYRGAFLILVLRSVRVRRGYKKAWAVSCSRVCMDGIG